MRVLIRMDNGDSYAMAQVAGESVIELIESLSDLTELFLHVELEDLQPEEPGPTQVSLKKTGVQLSAYLNKTLISAIEVGD
jgi:hypothetical protein